jgi:N-acetylglucosamine kinase-like BadF-type ATPase
VSGSVLLAIDGGNSKTDAALLSQDGSVLAAVRGPGSSPHHLGLDGSMRVVDRLVDAACRQAGLVRDGGPVAAVGAWFMAGADLPAEERALRRAVDRLRLAHRNHVANDTFAILRAGAEAGWGIAVVAGAGVNCVGLAPDGRTARFLALGEITGDWGGGPDIGMAALGAAVRAEDGRGPATSLTGGVAAHFGRRRASEVAVAVHQGRLGRDRLLELARLVMLAAESGDPVAASIIERQADEVVAMASAGLRRLRLTRLEVAVVLGGSILGALPPRFVEAIEAGVRRTAPGAACTVCRDRPVVGAALTALDLAGGSTASVKRLRQVLNDGGRTGRAQASAASSVSTDGAT